MNATRQKPVALSARDDLSVKERLLDGGEELFASHGFNAISARDIATHAGVQISSLTYHFGNKEGLFEAVIERRANALCERRLAALDAALVVSPCTTELILSAFMQPYVRLCMSDDPGWRNYAKLIAYVGQAPRWLDIVERYFNPTAHIFINSLSSLYPAAAPSTVVQAFVFATHLLTTTFAGTERVATLSKGHKDPNDFQTTYRNLLAYCVNGTEALLCSKRRGK